MVFWAPEHLGLVVDSRVTYVLWAPEHVQCCGEDEKKTFIVFGTAAIVYKQARAHL
jgi:hypothetical protein